MRQYLAAVRFWLLMPFAAVIAVTGLIVGLLFTLVIWLASED